jgi:hypothetical protein
MNTFIQWARWLFRRGVRSSLLLNMGPGDEVVAMIPYRQWLCISTRRGEIYMIGVDAFGSPYADEVDAAVTTIHRITP